MYVNSGGFRYLVGRLSKSEKEEGGGVKRSRSHIIF